MNNYNEDIRWWIDVICYNFCLMIEDLFEACCRRVKTVVRTCESLIRRLRPLGRKMQPAPRTSSRMMCFHHRRLQQISRP